MSEEVKGFVGGIDECNRECYLIFSSRRLFLLYPGWIGVPPWFLRIEMAAYDRTGDDSLDSFLTYLIKRGGDSKNILDELESKNIFDVLDEMMSRRKESFEIPYDEITQAEIRKRLFVRFIVIYTKTKNYKFRIQSNVLFENQKKIMQLVLGGKLVE